MCFKNAVGSIYSFEKLNFSNTNIEEGEKFLKIFEYGAARKIHETTLVLNNDPSFFSTLIISKYSKKIILIDDRVGRGENFIFIDIANTFDEFIDNLYIYKK